MVRAVATCTCKTCDNQFEKITFKQNRRLADSWVEWAEETLDECPQCYGKRMRELEEQKPLKISVTAHVYSQPCFYLIASGNTKPYKEALKKLGYVWSEKPAGGIFGPLDMTFSGYTWVKTIPINSADSEQEALLQCKKELEKAKVIGAEKVVVEMTDVDLAALSQVIAKEKKIRTEYEDELSGLQQQLSEFTKPSRPAFMPATGYWNRIIYGSEKRGWSIYVENKKIEISTDQKLLIEEYNSNFDEYMKQKAPIADKIKEIKRKIENECW